MYNVIKFAHSATRIRAYTERRFMKIYGDYHTHTFASDGRCSIFAHAKKADELGLYEIAVTDHGFASTIFHMTLRKWQKQKRQIADLKSKVIHRYRVLPGSRQ